ncbi:hypothetical protein CkaCkLH20_04193 [Colletotrichum karsti]|uniref:Uncharacterized protein n=1 Tax=Colletotrichum karsti TaxID=1095194 RepID=A0A9P6IG58_9PEZI|nr:uncharacterized protein CkaCkLH20_04193 [Colletotrichum karsti]KAF9878155.1 hypothetical protein CkaCkLH20_04193 [Colletotrichum karsti]
MAPETGAMPYDQTAPDSNSFTSASESQLALRMEKLGLCSQFTNVNKGLAKLMAAKERLSNAEVTQAIQECKGTWPEFEEQSNSAVLSNIMPHVTDAIFTQSNTVHITLTNLYAFIHILIIMTKTKNYGIFTSSDWAKHVQRVYKVTCLIMGGGLEPNEPQPNPWDPISDESLRFLSIMTLSTMEFVEESEKFASMVDSVSAKISELSQGGHDEDRFEIRARAEMLSTATQRHRLHMSTVIDQMQSDLITEVTRQHYPEALVEDDVPEDIQEEDVAE